MIESVCIIDSKYPKQVNEIERFPKKGQRNRTFPKKRSTKSNVSQEKVNEIEDFPKKISIYIKLID